jgi:uncharacterized protein
MTLKETILADLKRSMMEKHEAKTATLRMFISSMKNKEIELQKREEGLTEDEILAVIKQEVKKRKDAIGEYESAGRPELAVSEREELEILSVYLPPEVNDDVIREAVTRAIQETGAVSAQDFGKVMKHVMATLKNQASGDRITPVVKELLK